MHDEKKDWNEELMVFTYNLPPRTFQNQFHAIMRTVKQEANRIQEWCNELDVITQREQLFVDDGESR